ncbi:MAG: hypothetical protein GF416_02810 [Candidatus Altiarchaeales archaeon]|nr:hypothetical protein [Candidatus Altiarchaeales archaeon]MBD3416050.1 hypothetical protein [Candidatus Altiarchaeales archaeon]
MPDCSGCTACCRHVSIEVDEPDTYEELDEYLWLVLHEGVDVYIDDGDWYVEFKTKCTALADDGRCTRYEGRPLLCRNYDPKDCLKHGEEAWYDHYFTTPEELKAYWEKAKRAESQ